MFKTDWLIGCCTKVNETVEVKERRIKWLQMNVQGWGDWLLKPLRNFLFEVEQKSSYAIPVDIGVLRQTVFVANSERNSDRGLCRYSKLFIFVILPYVPILPTNIKIV
jgi:hypothetical protein